jgi:hypothetical protein
MGYTRVQRQRRIGKKLFKFQYERVRHQSPYLNVKDASSDALEVLSSTVLRTRGPTVQWSKNFGSNLLRTKESKDRVRVANYTVDGGRRISTITFGQPRCRTALKGMRALGLSVDVEAKQHDIPGLVETITKYLAERPTLEKYQPLSSKEHSYGNDENPSH